MRTYGGQNSMKTNVAQTSIEAYYSLSAKKLCDAQQTVLVAISAYPDSTDRELATHLGFTDPNRVRPRRFELEKMGLIACSGVRVCSVTGKKAYTWSLVGEA